MSPIIENLKKQKQDLINFRRFLWTSSKRSPCEIKVEFYNRKFKTSSGFAMLEIPGLPMEKILDAITQVVNDQVIELNRKIEEYELDDIV